MKPRSAYKSAGHLISELKNDGYGPDHLCRSGSVIKFGSSRCISDIELRIKDATHHRNSCGSRTAARQSYNGLLHELRRMLRFAIRISGI